LANKGDIDEALRIFSDVLTTANNLSPGEKHHAFGFVAEELAKVKIDNKKDEIRIASSIMKTMLKNMN